MKRPNKSLSLIIASTMAIISLTGCQLIPSVSTNTTVAEPDPVKPATSSQNPDENDDETGNDSNNENGNEDENSGNDNTDSGNNGSEGNDTIATEDDYMAFLNNETEVMITYLNANPFEFEKTYTYSELVDAVKQKIEVDWEGSGMAVQEVDYAIIDCGDDGNPELALNIISNTDDGYDENCDYYIIKKFQGGLCLVDYYNTYYRTEGELNKYGVFHTYGSSGFNQGYDKYERVNAEGTHEFIYDCSTENEIDEAVIFGYSLPSYAELPDDYPMNYVDAGKISKYAYCFEAYDSYMATDNDAYDEYLISHIYVFANRQDEVVYPEKKYMDIYDELNIKITDFEGIEDMIGKRLATLGITSEEMNFSWDSNDYAPNWIVFEDFIHTEGQGF